ncbi:MXAN_5187 C-terminal domain-containing protein [Archangium lipolyticum]|uniref:MXAN_5187 C-terminal domain-containing protein n=1 Tax=Archangium lipolyticum TaxID=2970465 RepID=UPI002149B493|nr:MXAN_5187 C-terminal domain-containing protein [Archangium lipolyticum]
MPYEPKSSTKNQVAKPGASTKSSARLAANDGDTKSGMPTKSGSEVALQECDAIEADLAALKVTYEHYFMGIDRTPPTRVHEDLKKRVEKLKSSFVRNTGAKFRVQAIHSKFMSYERLWTRTLQEIENGTYKRDVAKAKRRVEKKPTARGTGATQLPDSDFDVDEVKPPSMAPLVPSVAPLVPSVAPLIPPVAPVAGTPARGSPLPSIPSVAPLVPSVAPLVPPVAPAIPPVAPVGARPPAARPGTGTPAAARPAAPRPPAASGASDLSDDKLKSVYNAYVAAKRNNKEDTSKMSYDSIAASLRKQVPELMKQHGAKSVEFKVVIKDGKAVLKAVPK